MKPYFKFSSYFFDDQKFSNRNIIFSKNADFLTFDLQ